MQSNTPDPQPDPVAASLREIAANQPQRNFHFTDLDEMVEEMNRHVALVPMGKEMLFVFKGPEGDLILRRKKDAEVALGQYTYFPPKKTKPKHADKDDDESEEKGPKGVPGFPLWLKHPDRREYRKVVFHLNKAAARPDELNLWRGFAIEPAPGDYPLFKEHLLQNVCRGNCDHLHYLMSVLAQMFQEPWRKVGVAIVLIGEMGTGKSKVSEILGSIIGPIHAPAFDKLEHATGRFRGHLEQTLLARIEEGHAPSRVEDVSTLKHLITAPTVLIERKGLDPYSAPSYARFIITSNAKQAVAASVGERRLFVLNVGNGRKRDAKFFAALDKEMEAGGYAAFLHDLLHYDYSNVNFASPPVTEGLDEQIRLGFSAEEKWLEAILTEGRFLFADGGRNRGEWPDAGAFEIDKETVVQSFRDYVTGYKSPASPQQVGVFLSKQIPGLKQVRRRECGGRVSYWVFPALADVRAAFVENHPGYVFADDPEDVPGLGNAKRHHEPDGDGQTGTVVPMRRSRF